MLYFHLRFQRKRNGFSHRSNTMTIIISYTMNTGVVINLRNRRLEMTDICEYVLQYTSEIKNIKTIPFKRAYHLSGSF